MISEQASTCLRFVYSNDKNIRHIRIKNKELINIIIEVFGSKSENLVVNTNLRQLCTKYAETEYAANDIKFQGKEILVRMNVAKSYLFELQPKGEKSGK